MDREAWRAAVHGVAKSWTWLKVKSECGSRSVVSDSLQPHGLYSPRNSPGIASLRISRSAGRFFTSWATTLYMWQCHFPNLSHPTLPRTLCPQVCFLLLHLYSCPANRFSSVQLLSPMWLFSTPWTVQSMEFSRPEYWNGWVAFPFSRGSSQTRDQTQVSCIAGRFFTKLSGKAINSLYNSYFNKKF